MRSAQERWAPDQQRITPPQAAFTRAFNKQRGALRSFRGTT
jgi:hypothetical protein